MLRFIRITQEATFGTYNGSGSSINVRLSGDNSFTPMTDPEWWEIMDGSGYGAPVAMGSQTSALTATLVTEVTYTQAQFLLGWGLQRVNSGQTSPWTTGELPNDLASCTVDFAWSYFDTAVPRRKRFLGVKPGNIRLACSRESPKLMLSMQLIGSTPQGNSFDGSNDPTSTAFPQPALTAYPTDCVLFQHLKGQVSVGGTSRSNFESMEFNVASVLNPYFDESRFANSIRLGGRRITASSRFRNKSTVDDRTTYESATVQAASLEWTNGTHSITLGMNSQNYIRPYKEDLPLQREIYYNIGLASLLDQTAGNDLALTFT
jgi:hypothetical protein